MKPDTIHAFAEIVDAYACACADPSVDVKSRLGALDAYRLNCGGYEWREAVWRFCTDKLPVVEAAVAVYAEAKHGELDEYYITYWDSWDYDFVPWVAQNLLQEGRDGFDLVHGWKTQLARHMDAAMFTYNLSRARREA
jgi:hypothetical protein